MKVYRNTDDVSWAIIKEPLLCPECVTERGYIPGNPPIPFNPAVDANHALEVWAQVIGMDLQCFGGIWMHCRDFKLCRDEIVVHGRDFPLAVCLAALCSIGHECKWEDR